MSCERYECDDYKSIPVEVAKSANVNKTNTLHQFDDVGVVGVQSPVGKIPIVFYMKESCYSGRRGLLYYDDYDTVCWMYPEEEYAEWCEQPYDLRYDELVPFQNETERGVKREHGIFELWVSVWKHWYNGHIMYRPKLKIKGCGHRDGGYPSKSTIETVEEKVKTRRITTEIKKTKTRSCNCGKGA